MSFGKIDDRTWAIFVARTILGLIFFMAPRSLLMMLGLAACGDFEASVPERLLTLDDLEIQATFGLDEGAGPQAVFQKPIGAAFLGDEVLILDASAPWVRVFDRKGRFQRALVPEGEGPGEAKRPLTLNSTADGFLLGHARGISSFRPDGELLFTIPIAFRPAGAAEACGGVVALIADAEGPIFRTVLVRVARDGTTPDTLARFTPVRPSGRSYHPWYLLPSDGRMLVYPELVDRDVLFEIDCGGRLIRELAIDSLGAGERWMFGDGQLRISSPQPPRPSGMTRIGDRVLWATQTTEPSATGIDSITQFTAFEPGGSARQVRVQGWYQLYASDASGALLLGNTWTAGQNWTYGATWGGLPAVFLVSGRALLDFVDAMGTEVPVLSEPG